MIQRKQTIYLLAAAILMGLMLVMPIVQFTGINGVESTKFQLTACGFKSDAAANTDNVIAAVVGDTDITAHVNVNVLALSVIIAVAALLPLVAIFFYKKRKAQYKLCIVEVVILLLFVALVILALFVFRIRPNLDGYDASMFKFRPAAFFPVVSIFLIWLAMRGIRKDARLIKSLDRIR